MRIIGNMDAWQYLLALVFLLMAVLIAGRAYTRSIEIQEMAKSERSRANALERTNQAKLNGLFEMQIAKLAQVVGGDDANELAQCLELFGNFKKLQSDGSAPPPVNISWDVLKEQLKNPEIKKTILEHRDEALNILKD